MHPHRISPFLFAGWLTVSAGAAPIAINNPSFEALALAEDAVSISVPAGWAGVGPGTFGLFNPAAGGSFFSTADANDGGATGGSIGTMDGTDAVFANGAMSLTQTTGEAIVVGEQYTLTVAIGHRDGGGFGFGGYTIELLDGDSSLASESSNVSPGVGTFTDATLSYTALAGDSGNLGVRLSHNGNATVTEFDNVRLTTGTSPPVDPVTVSFPPSRYLVQRTASETGDIPISGTYTGGDPDRIEARAVVSTGGGNSGTSSDWQIIDAAPSGGAFSGALANLTAGGWYTLEVRSVTGGIPAVAVSVEKVGVGDIYVIAGQSNAGSYGSPQSTPADDRVNRMISIASGTWTKASDPMSPPDGLGGDGGGGSAWTRLGDLLTAMDDVPVGFVCIAVGGSGSFEWLPGTTYHTTRLRPVVQHFPSNGFRAVLWHQGEGDAFYQATANLYATQMAQIIAESRTDAGWDVPWYIAEASAVGGTNNFKGIPVLAGQRSTVFADSNVFLGPSTNEFYLEQKTSDGTHFNAAGLLDHATQWRDILGENTSLDVENHDFERNVTPAITGTGALADGAFYTIDHNAVGDPSILDWRELLASGVVKPDGDTGYYNPGSSQYANAVDTINGGVMANMDGRHVAFLAGGSAGNHVLQYRRKELLADQLYSLTVALGVRDGGSDVFGGVRIEILANGQVLGTGKTVTEADLDTLAGGSAGGKFTDVTFEFTTAGSVAGSQPVGVRIIKIDGGAATYLDFDNVRLTASPVVPAFLLNPMVGSITETGAAASAELAGAATDVTLFWATADYGTNLTAWQTNGSSDILGNLPAGTVNGSLTGLTADTVYALRFYAVDTAPDEEEWSAPVTFGTPFTTGQMVTDLAASAVAHDQIDLSWSDAFNTEEEYRIERSEDGTNWSGIATLPPGTTGFPDTGLSELTTYSYRILASSTQSGDSDWSNVAQDATPARPSSSIIFTEDFESPVGDALAIPAGATTFDNPVTTDVTPNSAGWAGRMQQTEAGLSPFSGNQFYEMNGSWAIDSSILFEVAAANTLTNGSTITVSLYSAGAFSDTVDETFDVILSGGAVGTQSDVSDGPQDTWQEHSFDFAVTDATQAVNLEILATRDSTLSEDLLIDLITVTSEVGNDFSAWIAGFPVGGLTGFNDDFDLDGLANGIENFFATNPSVANAGLTAVSSDGTSATFQHPQNGTPASDVTGAYEWSLDLENWNDSEDMVSGTTVTITPILNDPVAGTTTVTAAAIGTIPAKLFVRSKATQTM